MVFVAWLALMVSRVAYFYYIMTRGDAHGVRFLLYLTWRGPCGACFITFLTVGFGLLEFVVVLEGEG